MKYGNRKTTHNGEVFDSQRELKRWLFLQLLASKGEITDLKRQQRFVIAEPVVLDGRKRPARTYTADFVYCRNGQQIVEDSKGFKTEAYKLKRHLMKAIHGVEVLET